MLTHEDYHFSITVLTDDLAVLHCLRSLGFFAQKDENKQIAFGGTKESDWERHHHQVTFHFTSPAYRAEFEQQAKRLLPEDLWRKVGDSDENPATPQEEKESWL